MNTVTVSSKFQVVIPRDLRRLHNIPPGQKLKARIQYGRTERIPERTMTAARGFLAGIDTQVEREGDRESKLASDCVHVRPCCARRKT